MYLIYTHGTGVTRMYSYFHNINVICFNPLVFIPF